MNLLAILHAGQLHSLEPGNAIARAAQNAEFAAKLDGVGGAASYLLDQLLTLLEEQVEDAGATAARRRPKAPLVVRRPRSNAGGRQGVASARCWGALAAVHVQGRTKGRRW